MCKNSAFGVNRICKLLGISKTTYYQSKTPQERLSLKYSHIKDSIIQIITDNPKYGIRRIKQALFNQFGVSIGRDTLSKLLNLWALSLKRKIPKRKPSYLQKIIADLGDRANLLKRLTVNKPFQVVTSDITELVYARGKAYLCVHKDVFGQKIYGYAISTNMTKQLVINSFKLAVKQILELLGYIPKMHCHQDQGSQYTSYDYVYEVNKYMGLSYSQKGTPTDNPGQESFFGRFKEEWDDEIAEIKSFEELSKFVDEKIKYYNEQRLHTSIGYVTPDMFTNCFLEFEKNSFLK